MPVTSDNGGEKPPADCSSNGLEAGCRKLGPRMACSWVGGADLPRTESHATAGRSLLKGIHWMSSWDVLSQEGHTLGDDPVPALRDVLVDQRRLRR